MLAEPSRPGSILVDTAFVLALRVTGDELEVFRKWNCDTGFLRSAKLQTTYNIEVVRSPDSRNQHFIGLDIA